MALVYLFMFVESTCTPMILFVGIAFIVASSSQDGQPTTSVLLIVIQALC